MRKYAALLLTVLILATACSKGGKSGTDMPVAVPDTPAAVPELPPAKVEVPPDNVASRLAISSLAATPVGGAGPAGASVTAKDDAGWVKAKAGLVKLLEQSPNTPAPGLQEALLAYYRRPDVAALRAAVADPVHTFRLNQYVGTKEDPGPNAPAVIKVNPLYDGAPAWSLSLVQWKSGEKVQAAPLAELNAMTARSVTYQGRPAILVFQFATPTSPLSLSAYTLGENKLEPISLTVPPAVMDVTPTAIGAHQVEFRSVGNASIRHPDFYWACFGESCLNIEWSDANGLALRPTGFGSAEASKRLTDSDGNRMPVSNVDQGAYIDARLADPATLDEAPGALSQRLGAKVATARSGDAVARAVSFTSQSWLGGKGYQYSFGRIQFRGAGVTYATLPFGGGGYIDHRVLQEGNKVYLLLLTETEPRPTFDTILHLYVAEGGKVQAVDLPESIQRGPRRHFVSMDARLLLSCPPTVTNPAECSAIRLEGDNLVTLKAGALRGEPPAEAKQAREKALAQFQAKAYPEAAQLFRQATELAPLWVDAWNDLSLAYQQAGDWPSALTAANTAVRLDQKSPAGLYNLGLSYLGLGDTDSAVAFLDQAAKLQPKSVVVWMALARAREQAHLRITAVAAYNQVLQLEPGNAEAAAGLKRVEALLPPK